MKAHIARNQNAGIPLALGWNLSAADRGILEEWLRFRDEAAAGLPCRCRQDRGPAAGRGGSQDHPHSGAGAGCLSPALVLANFKDKDVDTLLDLMKQAQVNIPLKAVVTPTSKNWVFGDLLAHLQEEHTAFTAAKETAKA